MDDGISASRSPRYRVFFFSLFFFITSMSKIAVRSLKTRRLRLPSTLFLHDEDIDGAIIKSLASQSKCILYLFLSPSVLSSEWRFSHRAGLFAKQNAISRELFLFLSDRINSLPPLLAPRSDHFKVRKGITNRRGRRDNDEQNEAGSTKHWR